MKIVDFVDAGYTLPQQTATEVKITKQAAERVKKATTYVPITPPSRYRHEIEQIRFIAEKTGYKEVDLQLFNKMISFKKGNTRINVYYSTMTVGTCLHHPKKGATQLFRRNVSFVLLEKLFANPRQHTGIGYREL